MTITTRRPMRAAKGKANKALITSSSSTTKPKTNKAAASKAPSKSKMTKKRASYKGSPVTTLPDGFTWPTGWTEQHVPRTKTKHVDKYWYVPVPNDNNNNESSSSSAPHDKHTLQLRSIVEVTKYLTAIKNNNTMQDAYGKAVGTKKAKAVWKKIGQEGVVVDKDEKMVTVSTNDDIIMTEKKDDMITKTSQDGVQGIIKGTETVVGSPTIETVTLLDKKVVVGPDDTMTVKTGTVAIDEKSMVPNHGMTLTMTTDEGNMQVIESNKKNDKLDEKDYHHTVQNEKKVNAVDGKTSTDNPKKNIVTATGNNITNDDIMDVVVTPEKDDNTGNVNVDVMVDTVEETLPDGSHDKNTNTTVDDEHIVSKEEATPVDSSYDKLSFHTVE